MTSPISAISSIAYPGARRAGRYNCLAQYCSERTAPKYVHDEVALVLKANGRTPWLQRHLPRRPQALPALAERPRSVPELEVNKLHSAERSSMSWQECVAPTSVVAPVLVLAYFLLWKGLILDGWPGWICVCQRTIAELILSLCLAEARLARPAPPAQPT